MANVGDWGIGGMRGAGSFNLSPSLSFLQPSLPFPFISPPSFLVSFVVPRYFHVLRVAEDVCAAVGFARRHQSVDPAQVVLFGYSMGAHGAAIAALKLQEEAATAPVQGLMMVAPRVLTVLPPNGWVAALSLDSPLRAMYTVAKITAGLFCSGVQVTQHMESHSQVCAVMADSWCSWPIIPDGHMESGHNTLAVETMLPLVFPSQEVRDLSGRFKTLSARVLMIFGRDDVRLGSDPAKLQRLFESKPGEPATVLNGPGEHISQLPMINPSQYAAHKDTYTRASDTYTPGVYPDHNLPAFQAFLAAVVPRWIVIKSGALAEGKLKLGAGR